ncbi:Fe-S cluster assembly protein SufD [Bacillus sp. HMF5848]|uniref:Fe-S cluster assembly protein SufD n=1 Tax=Bacillus sp. HMF5848 TaxID=2495421 RepID=UPI000F79F952|nr:Fe-S cluster assembly protein SufD [Bacillus sp. HMF5848]RSK29430.1 Fe-S cluster assembly protein SufD [Bacillus sp. HMF5848]
MTVDTTTLPFDKEYINDYSSKNNEPNWLTELRTSALEKLVDLPLPKADKTRIAKWNFTGFDTHSVVSDKYASVDELPESVRSLIETGEDVENNLYVQRDQTPAYSIMSDELKQQGVVFTDIYTAVKEHEDLVKKYYMNGVKIDEHKLAALHAAYMNGGVFVYVPKNVEVKTPLQAVFIHEQEKATLFNHVIVVADDNSSVTYVENYVSNRSASEGVVNIVTEVFANTNARVSFGAVDNLGKDVTAYVNRRGVAGRDAKIEWALGLMNDGNTVSENTTNLIGDGSFGDTKTVVVGTGDQTQNFTTKVVHFGKHSEGYILKHGVMKDNATSIFNGIGKIEHGATKSNAEQESRVLMLSEKARGDANPILLIEEDDVTAGHAASVGRVDPIQLYYMMSRGVSRTEAERLIIHGFLAPVVEQLPIESVKEQLSKVIERKIK